jgi:hypothetical protein
MEAHRLVVFTGVELAATDLARAVIAPVEKAATDERRNGD